MSAGMKTARDRHSLLAASLTMRENLMKNIIRIASIRSMCQNLWYKSSTDIKLHNRLTTIREGRWIKIDKTTSFDATAIGCGDGQCLRGSSGCTHRRTSTSGVQWSRCI